MKNVKIIIFSLLCLLSIFTIAQNAPVTTAGSVTNAVPGGTVSIPVTVSNFMNIGGITLTLDYDPAVLVFNSATYNAGLTDMSISASTPGRILIGWFGASGGVTLPDMTQILNITFTYNSGSSNLTWDNTLGNCEYAIYGSGVGLTDLPTSSFYFNGLVTNHAAPITKAPVITSLTGGVVTVPITVTNFKNIKAISLTLEYDPNLLTYQSATVNAAFGTGMIVSSQPSTGGKRKIRISYIGSLVASLPDDSHIVDLVFSYSFLSGINSSELIWVNGGSSEYVNQLDESLVDDPTADYYKNGLVASQVAPLTILPVVGNAVAGNILVPVKVIGFKNIKVLSLSFEYNPAVMTFSNSFTANVLLSGLTVSTINHPSNGNKILRMSWLGSGPVTIPDNENIAVLNFSYISGTTNLIWVEGASCEYADVNDNPLWDMPTATYYTNGLVTSHLCPRTKAEKTAASGVGASVSVPVNVWNFSNIGAFSLSLDFDPGVLTYVSATPNAAIAVGLNIGVSAGRLLIGWYATGAPVTLPDSTAILTLNFTYLGGTSPLNFYNNGGTCEYAEGITNNILYDLPTENFYKNGSVYMGTTPVLNAKVFLEGPFSSGAMSTTLNTLGLIPLTQPYSGSPWNYSGTEAVTSIPANVTDWILVELRTGTASSTKIASRAGFLKNNGAITDLDGTSTLKFTGLSAGSYYVVIRHRNHMPVMSAVPVSVSSSGILYDFSSGLGQSYGGANATKNLDGTRWGMMAGDATNDGNIFLNDYTIHWLPDSGIANGYKRGDFKMDGNVFITDYTNCWLPNSGKYNVLP